jgi:hypothetical protein
MLFFGGAEFLTITRYSPKTSVFFYGLRVLYNEQDEIVEALINLLTIKKNSKFSSSAGWRPVGQDGVQTEITEFVVQNAVRFQLPTSYTV